MRAARRGDSPQPQVTEEVMHVTVGKNFNRGKRNLAWVLHNFPVATIVIVHVHSPSARIPILGATFLYTLATEEQKAFHEKREKEKMIQLLVKYIQICVGRKVKAVWIAGGDVSNGILRLVQNKQIKILVTGSRSMAKEAALLQQCQVHLIRNGRHFSTSEPVPQLEQDTQQEQEHLEDDDNQHYITQPSELENRNAAEADLRRTLKEQLAEFLKSNSQKLKSLEVEEREVRSSTSSEQDEFGGVE